VLYTNAFVARRGGSETGSSADAVPYLDSLDLVDNADSDNHSFALRTFLDFTNTETMIGILHRKCGVVFGRPLSPTIHV
jgi:hypothetical protein